ncbi:MAG: cupredoxin domain-containing protein, partial [Actinomycetota bacterium]
MNDILVIAGGAALTAFGLWYFFGPKGSSLAELEGGVQRVNVVVQGAYVPNIIRVHQGVPLQITFDRREGGECTSRVVFPDFRKAFDLSAFATTTVTFKPDEVGQFGFACGMNMVHGTLVVEPNGVGGREAATEGATEAPEPEPTPAEEESSEILEDTEAAARRAEVRELAWRVAAGA